MREAKSPGEEQASWKAPEQAIEAPEVAEATPEGLIEQVPQKDRSALRQLAEKVLGRPAIEGLVTVVRTQAGLLRELGSGLKTPINWEGIDKKRALAYGAYLFIGAMAAELSSPDSSEAVEGEQDDVLKHIMFEAMPHDPDGSPMPLDQLTDSQKSALGVTYELRQIVGAKGGTPALFEMQTEDIWRVQQEIGADTKNFQYEQSRAWEVERWGERVMQQYEMQKDMPEQALADLDKAVEAAEGIEGLSAQERIIFKEAAIKAITGPGTNADQIRTKIEGLLQATEMIQGQKFYNQQSENIQLESALQGVLAGELEERPAPSIPPPGEAASEGVNASHDQGATERTAVEKVGAGGEHITVTEGELTPEESRLASQEGTKIGVGIVQGKIDSLEDFIAAVEQVVGGELSAQDQKDVELTYKGVAPRLERGIDQLQIDKITMMLRTVLSRS